ncbi:MAG TPA: hypothetical protein VM510_00680 [Caulifigura sp.]|nr:hypothetical protein [Caulifigura sp.]
MRRRMFDVSGFNAWARQAVRGILANSRQTAPRQVGGYGLMLVVMLGCSDPDPVRQYTVTKPVPADSFTPSPGAAKPAEQRQAVWFFKMTGQNEAVVATVEPFTRFINSVKLGDDGRPKWTLPEGWTERPETGLRFATIQIPGDSKLEVAVSSLPALDPASTEYLLSNFNRWRGQLGLGEVVGAEGLKQSQDKGELQQLDSAGRRITLINLTGKTAENSDARSVIAMVSSAASKQVIETLESRGSGRVDATPARPSAPSTASGDAKPFTYTLPAGWKEAPLKTFQLAAFSAGEADNPLSISISSVGGDLAANVNRWRGQAGLADQSEQEISDASMPIKVDGIDAKYFIVQGATRSILGVVLMRNDRQWFIKADGPTATAMKEREAFEGFAKSVHFK